MNDVLTILRAIANRAGRPTMEYSRENAYIEQRESLDWIAAKAAEAIRCLAEDSKEPIVLNHGVVFTGQGFAPPRCLTHGTNLVLTFFDRPGGPQGNTWVCQACISARENKQ